MKLNSKFKALLLTVALVFGASIFTQLGAITNGKGPFVQLWFKSLNTNCEHIAFAGLLESMPVKRSQLQAGDIILKKIYVNPNLVIGAVVGAQKKLFDAARRDTFQSSPGFTVPANAKGSFWSGHVMLYMGNNEVAESSNDKKGVVLSPITDYDHYGLVVYRCTDKEAITAAGLLARKWVELPTKKKIGYSSKHCLTAFSNTSKWGTDGMGRQKALFEDKNRKPPTKNMMCSEFVTYLYQVTEFPTIRLDAKHTAPIRLEEYLNKSNKFTLVGAVRARIGAAGCHD
ncbi:MAG: hypothetical protein GY754_36035 [bacterium]|nr:hypothetical protein [bacterium]